MRTEEMLLTAREAAEAIGTTTRTLRRWRDAGYGPEWRRIVFPKGQIRYPERRLRTWMAKGRTNSNIKTTAA